jgi:hypothetical protein
MSNTHWGPGKRRAGGAASDADTGSVPIDLSRLVRLDRVDLDGEIKRLLGEGRRQITVGIGADVDIQLLDDDLLAADAVPVERTLVVLTLRAESTGYVVQRGESNFGLFVWEEASPWWEVVPRLSEIRDLRPGDRISLGSTPAEGLQVVLPATPLVGSVRPADLGQDRAYQEAVRVALLHWRYRTLVLSSRHDAEVVLDDVMLTDLVVHLHREPDDPEIGLVVEAVRPEPDLWVKPRDESIRYLSEGGSLRLKGGGHRLGFDRYVIDLPPLAEVTARFSSRVPPSDHEVRQVLGLSEAEADDPKAVKRRYRALVRRFHPDRPDARPGHTSRFLEVQACYETWERRR